MARIWAGGPLRVRASGADSLERRDAAEVGVVRKDPESFAESCEGAGGVAHRSIDFSESGISCRIGVGKIALDEFQLRARLRPKLLMAVELAQIAVGGVTVGFAAERREKDPLGARTITEMQQELSEPAILARAGAVVGGDSPGLPISRFRPGLAPALDRHHGLDGRHVIGIARQDLPLQ